MKLFATTRAYEFAKDVGIASPDVLCVEEFIQVIPPDLGATPANQQFNLYHKRYGTLICILMALLLFLICLLV